MTPSTPTQTSDHKPDRPATGALARLRTIWRDWRIGQRMGMALVVLAVAASLMTYAVFTDSVPFLPATPSVLLVLLNLDLVLFLAVAVLVVRRVVLLWGERRRGIAGSGLHVRLVALLSLAAGLPAVLVTTFSIVFLHFGLQGWFSEQVDKALTASLHVAEAYLQEHSGTVARDVLAVATEMRRSQDDLTEDPSALAEFLNRHLRWRGLQAAVVFSGNGKVDARVGDLASMAEELVPDWAIKEARSGEVAVVVARSGDQLRGLVRVSEDANEQFLYIGKAVDQEVLGNVGDVRAAVSRFQRLQTERADIELTFGAIFAMLALLLVVIAIWFGLAFAGRLARPIALLVEAAERVRAGDLEVHLEDMGETGEFQSLGRAFNRMTTQLRAQRQELVEANRQLDQRRRFTEAVLSGVAAGVVGLDEEGRIRFPNNTASQLLGIDLNQHRDEPLASLLPEVGPLIDRAHRWRAGTTEGQVTQSAEAGGHTFLIRVTAETGGEGGSVVTFTDITDLLDAQRKAAWSDIARRIAHEIKNPLTPIQLSAERLKRRYLPQVTNDPETFQLCTDTIVRQVDGLRRLVDEFSDFARLPAPQMSMVNLTALAREVVSLQQGASPKIAFELVSDPSPLSQNCDESQVSRVLTNLLQNASEAVQRRLDETDDDSPGAITVSLSQDEHGARIVVTDNGAGLPVHLRDRLADPYVTTRAKGTGLGLAIVQKIAADHGGALQFDDRPGGGAIVTVTLASVPTAQGHADGA